MAAALLMISGWLASDLRRDAGQLAASTTRGASELETLVALHRAVHEGRSSSIARTRLHEVAAVAEAVVFSDEVAGVLPPSGAPCSAGAAGRRLTVDLHRGCAALVLQVGTAAAVAPR